jgi:hypothetical protein
VRLTVRKRCAAPHDQPIPSHPINPSHPIPSHSSYSLTRLDSVLPLALAPLANRPSYKPTHTPATRVIGPTTASTTHPIARAHNNNLALTNSNCARAWTSSPTRPRPLHPCRTRSRFDLPLVLAPSTLPQPAQHADNQMRRRRGRCCRQVRRRLLSVPSHSLIPYRHDVSSSQLSRSSLSLATRVDDITDCSSSAQRVVSSSIADIAPGHVCSSRTPRFVNVNVTHPPIASIPSSRSLATAPNPLPVSFLLSRLGRHKLDPSTPLTPLAEQVPIGIRPHGI